MSSWVLWLELGVGLFISLTMLILLLKSISQGQFDDTKRQMNGLLFDSVEDLQDAINKENKVKALKKKKAEKQKVSVKELKAKIIQLREKKEEARTTKDRRNVEILRRRINGWKKQTRKVAQA